LANIHCGVLFGALCWPRKTNSAAVCGQAPSSQKKTSFPADEVRAWLFSLHGEENENLAGR